MYAEVVVNDPLSRVLTAEETPDDLSAPLGAIYHYEIPPFLQATLQPGHMVWAPFGERRLQGIVVGLSQTSPVAETKSLSRLVLDEPVLTPAQLALARWMSRHYLVPLLECIRLMLPPGLLRSAEAVLAALTPAPFPPDLTAPQRELMTLLQDGPLSLRRLKRRRPELARRSVIDPLVQGGLVARRQEVVKPPLREKTGRRVRLLVDAAGVADMLPRLGHASKQANVLLWLAASEDPLPSLAAVQQGAGCTDAPIRALTERGWVDVLAARKLVVPMGSTEALKRAAEELANAPSQAAALAILGAEPTPLDEAELRARHGIGGGTLRALEERGLIRRVEEEARVLLRLEGDEVLDAVVELRGAGKHKAVLDAFLELAEEAGEGEPVAEWIGWVYAETGCSLDTLRDLEAQGLLAIEDEEIVRDPLAGREFVTDVPPQLTADQAAVWQVIEEGIGRQGDRETGRQGDGERGRQGKRELGRLVDRETGRQVHREHGRLADWGSGMGVDRETDALTAGEASGRDGQSTSVPTCQSTDVPTYQSTDDPVYLSTDVPVYLLHGVTGSGKTEIYLRAIARTLSAGRQSIVLVPEISLTPQTVRRFAARFPGRVGVIHSELSAGERYDTWRRIAAGKVDIVIGPRSALFQPLLRLGLIVIDEEHDDSYKQDDLLARRLVRYHARQVALQLGRLCQAPVILGSATPAMETYHDAQLGLIQLLELPQRILGHRRRLEQQRAQAGVRDMAYRTLEAGSEARFVDLPKVEVVDLRHELRVGNRSMFSRTLQEALAQTLAARQQAILFLNRRGAATFVMCRDCGHVLRCRRCEVPYTVHLAAGEDEAGETQAAPDMAQGILVCHHCNRQEAMPERCPQCDSRRIRHFGVGTQQVEVEVKRLFRGARTMRWDWDVTRGKGAHEAILAQFSDHQADILIGTQMIAKGLDLPLVTLVGVVTADTALYLPDYRAGERTFQLLTQVAGRAGRGILGGRVIVQTYTPEHYAIRAAARHDHAGFYEQEIGYRRELGYPPVVRMARVVAVDADVQRCREAAEDVADMLQERLEGRPDAASLIGPAPCFFARHRGRSRWQVVLRAPDPAALLRGLPFPPNCWVDVDPVSLL